MSAVSMKNNENSLKLKKIILNRKLNIKNLLIKLYTLSIETKN